MFALFARTREEKYLRFASCQSITSGWRHVLNARMRSMFVKDDINLSIHVWRYIYETRIRHEAWWMMAGERKRPFSRISFFFSPFPDSLSFCVSLSIACLVSTLLYRFFLQFRLSLYRCSPQSFSPNCIYIYIYINVYACGKIFLESLIIISSRFVYRNRRIDDVSLSIESDRNDFRKECIFLYTKLNILIFW